MKLALTQIESVLTYYDRLNIYKKKLEQKEISEGIYDILVAKLNVSFNKKVD